jgi:hypothetical protein
MSNTLARWKAHPSAPAFGLPTDPTERDRYIVDVVRQWARGAERRLDAALTAWQSATGRERDLCRYDLRRRIEDMRVTRELNYEVWLAYCRDVHERAAMREAA